MNKLSSIPLNLARPPPPDPKVKTLAVCLFNKKLLSKPGERFLKQLEYCMSLPTAIANDACMPDHFVVLIRHGETDWNAEQRFQGQRDIPLNPRGRNQAEKVARSLRYYPLEAIVSSDLSRAADTAKCIGAYHPAIPIQTHAGLREVAHGDFWEGKTEENLFQSDPLNLWRWKNRPTQTFKPGGELLENAFARVTAAFDELRSVVLCDAQSNCPIIAVVGHEGTNRLILCYSLGLSLETHFTTWMLPNCAIAILEFKAGNAHARFHGATINSQLFSTVI